MLIMTYGTLLFCIYLLFLYPISAIFFNSSSLRILIFLTFVSMSFSLTNAERVRMQLLVVMLAMFARSSRLRLQSRVELSFASP